MKFVKANLTLVICGAVVVLALVAWLVWPLPSVRADLSDRMKTRYSDTETIKKLENTSLELPGGQKEKGPPDQAWIDAKRNAIGKINEQEKEVERESHDFNKKLRVSDKGVPLLPLPSFNWAKEEIDVLPVKRGDKPAFDFKADYQLQFKEWASLLAFGKADDKFDPASAIPPTSEQLNQKFDKTHQSLVVPGAGGGAAAAPSEADKQRFIKNEIYTRANELFMYVEPSAFQRRPWVDSENPPTESDIFNGMVDSWIQADVVRAIYAVNRTETRAAEVASAQKSSKDPVSHNIDKSAVKRLIHISVGNDSRTHTITGVATVGGGSAAPSSPTGDPTLFYTTTVATTGSTAGPVTGTLVNGGQAAAQPAAPNTLNYAVGMTGHSSGGDYDVVLLSIWMDIDPAQLVNFMNELYKRNVGYTITDVQMRTVDPLDRASNGYIYGNQQVVEVEIQAEAILFRGWTTPLMPADVKASLGIPAAK